MKRWLAISFACCVLRASAADLVTITNNTMVTTWSDSFGRADFGQRQNFFLGSYFISYYPQFFVSFRDHSRSGGSNWEMLTNRIPRFGVVDAGFNRGKTNSLNIWYVSGNDFNGPHTTGTASNNIYLIFKDILKYPTNTYTRAAVPTNDWTQSNAQFLYKSVVIGDVIYNNLSTSSHLYSDGGSNAAFEAGAPFISTWDNMAAVVTANAGTAGTLWFPNGGAFDHPNNVFDLIWTLTNLRSLGVPTNTYTCILDFNSALIAQTNNCEVTGLALSGHKLSFTFHADRMAPGFYVPDGFITNDCRGAFNLVPSLGNAFCEILQATNLPVGNYQIRIDGSNVVILSSAQLSTGWNQFTNYSGAFWAQKKEILGQMCDMAAVSRADANTPTGNLTGLLLFESGGNTFWDGISGVDNYIAETHMAANETGLITGADVPMHATAQQTNHTYEIELIVPRYIGAFGHP